MDSFNASILFETPPDDLLTQRRLERELKDFDYDFDDDDDFDDED
ncbi:hypothetical protein F995_01081 [Acinetobacter sp. CIP A162]|nr:hypothetical protein F995_01081 [Acinetobacter sp. CIP A162]